jgi:hypothetical protein
LEGCCPTCPRPHTLQFHIFSFNGAAKLARELSFHALVIKGTLIATSFHDFNHKIVASIAQLMSTTQVNDVQHVLAHSEHSVGKPPCNAVNIVAWPTTGT